MSDTVLMCADGNPIDLCAPKLEDISFRVICEHLAKVKRFNGATRGVEYSVAQHSELCATAALLASGDRTLAAYLLLHDFHEAYIGDDTRPKMAALANSAPPDLGWVIRAAYRKLRDRLDEAIHKRAGLEWPIPSQYRPDIDRWDVVLFATEWRDLMKWPAPQGFPELPIPDRIEADSDWQVSAQKLMRRCRTLLPAAGFG